MTMEIKSDLNNDFLQVLNDWNFRRKFLEKRVVFFWGPVYDETARELVNQLLYLEMLEPGKEIKMYINSPGGSVSAGLSIYDTIKSISSPVSTICLGIAASMGAVLLSAGEKGRRKIFPNAEVMIHQPSLGGPVTDQAANLYITAEHIKKTKERLTRILAENTGQPYEKVLKDSDRDHWMDAQESLNYGIVDQIIDKIEF
jgi:ATP-dependent Clp protease protease subunit